MKVIFVIVCADIDFLRVTRGGIRCGEKNGRRVKKRWVALMQMTSRVFLLQISFSYLFLFLFFFFCFSSAFCLIFLLRCCIFSRYH